MKAAVVNQEDFAEASYRNSDHEVVTTAWSDLDAGAVAAGVPWRTFPWYLGQESYSGVYWCATVGSLVGYESRLELSHLMMADFDRSVKRIASQPFQLRHCTNGVIHRRVPEYLLCTDKPQRTSTETSGDAAGQRVGERQGIWDPTIAPPSPRSSMM
jgi:hypothetical protein